jgi:hypothetical protein
MNGPHASSWSIEGYRFGSAPSLGFGVVIKWAAIGLPRHSRNGLMAGESIYFDLATLCEQAGLDRGEIRAAAKARAERGA